MRRNSDVESSGSVNPRLDHAARAYTEGQYDEAVRSWQEVLHVDPANLRARQGIKKVQMLRAQAEPDTELPADSTEKRVHELLAARQFKAVADLCRQLWPEASSQRRARLEEWRQRAERAAAAEPSIKRCLESARREIQAGNINEALASLKQVLALDRQHPVAARLVEGIQKRARRRERSPSPSGPGPVGGLPRVASSPPQAGSQAGVLEEGPSAGPLPASGQPGSDAVPFSLDSVPQPPAPLGCGLPSSPLLSPDDPSIPEIELEMIPLEEDGAQVDDEAVEEGMEENVVADETVPSVRLEPAALDPNDHRRAMRGDHSESPFMPAPDGAGQAQPSGPAAVPAPPQGAGRLHATLKSRPLPAARAVARNTSGLRGR